MPWLPSLTYLASSWLAATLLTTLIIPVAHATGWLDVPDGRHKRHQQPVAYLGGLVLWLCVSGALLNLHSSAAPWSEASLGWWLPVTIMVAVGLWDDKAPLTAAQKFSWQGLSIGLWLVLYYLEAVPKGFAIVQLHWWQWLWMGFWLLLCCNAWNLLDVADGLVLGITLVALAALLVCAQPATMGLPAPILAAALGACLGLLPFNAPPARIYLGDAGSLFLGLLLGIATLPYTLQYQCSDGLLAAIGLLIVPLMEVLLLCQARLQQGIAPWLASPDHMALRLRHQGWSKAAIIRWTMLYTTFGAGIAMLAWSNIEPITVENRQQSVLYLQLAFALLLLPTLRYLIHLPRPQGPATSQPARPAKLSKTHPAAPASGEHLIKL